MKLKTNDQKIEMFSFPFPKMCVRMQFFRRNKILGECVQIVLCVL